MTSRLASIVLALVALCVAVPGASAATFDASNVAISPDGASVYSGQTGNGFSVFARDASTGQLSSPVAAVSPTGAVGCGGPFTSRWIAITSDSKHVYTTGCGNNEIYQWLRTSAGITLEATYANNQNGVSGLKNPWGTLIVGDDLYVSAYDTPGIVHFDIDPTTGNLTFSQALNMSAVSTGINEMVASPDGSFIYAGSSTVAWLSRASNGDLTIVNSGGGFSMGLAITNDANGSFVYATDHGADTINIFSRDAVTGAVASVGSVSAATPGVSGLDMPMGMDVSGDNKHLYVVGREDHAITAFSIDAATGALTYIHTLFDNANGVNGLDYAGQLVVSPDDKHVYTAAAHDNGIGVFSRNATSGQLTFVELASDSQQAGGGGGGAAVPRRLRPATRARRRQAPA